MKIFTSSARYQQPVFLKTENKHIAKFLHWEGDQLLQQVSQESGLSTKHSFKKSYNKQEVECNDPYGSLPAWDSYVSMN